MTYIYDAFNRLVEVRGSTSIRFYYDDQWRVIEERNLSDAVQAKYVYGPGIDEPVRMKRGGVNYYYHAAALGTVTEITDSIGSLVERYTYDVYGKPTLYDSGSQVIGNSICANRFLFQGRDRDRRTGLYNFRNRYYSPSLGRFVQVDPIRLSENLRRFVAATANDLNIYGFGHNDPVSATDPFGLACKSRRDCARDLALCTNIAIAAAAVAFAFCYNGCARDCAWWDVRCKIICAVNCGIISAVIFAALEAICLALYANCIANSNE